MRPSSVTLSAEDKVPTSFLDSPALEQLPRQTETWRAAGLITP